MAMPDENPYAAPRSEVAPRNDEHSVDLYMQTLPTTNVRNAGIASMLAGGGMILSALQAAAGARGIVGAAIVAVFAGLAISYLLVSWGIGKARMWSVVLGFVLVPIAAVASLFFAVAVSFLGLVDGILLLVHLVLLIAATGDARRMAHARSVLAQSGEVAS